jgi:hypothetical protein
MLPGTAGWRRKPSPLTQYNPNVLLGFLLSGNTWARRVVSHLSKDRVIRRTRSKEIDPCMHEPSQRVHCNAPAVLCPPCSPHRCAKLTRASSLVIRQSVVVKVDWKGLRRPPSLRVSRGFPPLPLRCFPFPCPGRVQPRRNGRTEQGGSRPSRFATVTVCLSLGWLAAFVGPSGIASVFVSLARSLASLLARNPSLPTHRH